MYRTVEPVEGVFVQVKNPSKKFMKGVGTTESFDSSVDVVNSMSRNEMAREEYSYDYEYRKYANQHDKFLMFQILSVNVE